MVICLEDEGLTEDDLGLVLRRGGEGEGGASISIGSSSSSSMGVTSRRGGVTTLLFYSIVKVSQEKKIFKKRKEKNLR